MIGLFGGAFDPPHKGHVALVEAAVKALKLDRVLILLSADPGHKQVETPAIERLELARAAFPGRDVILDEHGRTVDLLRAHPSWKDTVFLIGADQFCDFLSWKEPAEVLKLTRIGVATRPGYPQEQLDRVVAKLSSPKRVLFFELDPVPVASSDLRHHLDREAIPPAVWEIIERDSLYGYSGST